MKYIMFEVEMSGQKQKIPIIFPDHLVHRMIASNLMPALREHFPKGNVTVDSAGDIKLQAYQTCGKSETLKTVSKKDDKDIINLYDIEHGIIV